MFNVLKISESLLIMFSRWTNQGSRKKLPRTNPQYLKSYYYIKADGKSNKAFKKEVYFPVENPDEVCIVHYLGDATVSEPSPLAKRLRAKFWPDCAIPDTSMKFGTVVDHD